MTGTARQEPHEESGDSRVRRLARYIERARAREVLDDQPADELVGYDADGLPS